MITLECLYQQKVPVEVAVESVEYKRTVKDLVIMIAPFAPMFSSECWMGLKQVFYMNFVDRRLPFCSFAFIAF